VSEYASRDANATTYAPSGTPSSTAGDVPKATPAERAHDAITLAVRDVGAVGRTIADLKQTVDASDPASWHPQKSRLDRDLATARKRVGAARTNESDADPAARSELARAEATLAEQGAEASTFTSPPRGWSPVTNEEQIVAILAAPIVGSKQEGYAEKEAQLKVALAQLSPTDSQRLAARLAKPMKDDPIAAAFARLAGARKKAILTFLDDARKRTVLAQDGTSHAGGAQSLSEANAIIAIPAQEPLDAHLERMIDAGEPDLDMLMQYDGTQRRALARRLETYRPGNGDVLGARFVRLDSTIRVLFLSALRADGSRATTTQAASPTVATAKAPSSTDATVVVPKELQLDPAAGAVATSSAGSETDQPSPSFGAVAKYLQINSVPAWNAIAIALQQMVWPAMSPRLEYQNARLDNEISEHLHRALGSFELTALKELLYPHDVVSAIEPYLPPGDVRVFPSSVGVVLGQIVHAVLAGSVPRMAARYVDVADTMFAAAPTSAPTVKREQLVTSHPMDRVVARALTTPGVANVAPDADVITGKRKVKNPALREIKLVWEGEKDPALWNFVRAAPADATAEEVAASLFAYARDASGDAPSFYAYGIAAAPPLFGLPASWAFQFPEALAHAPAAVKSGKLPDATNDTIGARLTTLATSNDSDALALQQTPRDAHALRPSRDEVLNTLDECTIQLEHLRNVLVPWELSAPVIGETIYVAGKRSQLANAAPDQLGAWAAIASGQRDRLREIAEMVANVTKAAGALGTTTKRTGRSDPLRDILARLSEAAGTSHLASTSERILTEARNLQAGLSLRALQSNVAALESAVTGAEAVAPSDKHASDISHPYEQTKEDAQLLENMMLNGGEVSADELERVQLDAQELALRARIHSLQVQLDQIEGQWIQERAGVLSHVVATSKFKDIFGASMFIHQRLGDVYRELNIPPTKSDPTDPKAAAATDRAAKRGAVARAQALFRSLCTDQDLSKFFKDAYATMRSQQLRTAIAQAAAMLLISLASVGVGSAVAEGIGEGFLAAEGVETVTELSLGARAAIQVGAMSTEVMGNAVGQTLTTNTSFASAIVDNAMFVVGAAGTSKALGKLLEDIPAAAAFEKFLTNELVAIEAQEARATVAMSKLAQAGKAAVWVGKQAGAVTGHTVMGMAMGVVVAKAHELAGAQHPSPQQLEDWLIQGASIAIGRLAHAAIGERFPSLQRLAQRKEVTRAQALYESAMRLSQKAQRLITDGEPRLALEVLNERIRVLETEIGVEDELAQSKPGAVPPEGQPDRADLKTQLTELRGPEMRAVRWRLLGLDSLGAGEWAGTPARIASAIEDAREAGSRAEQIEDQPETTRLKIDGEELTLHAIAEQQTATAKPDQAASAKPTAQDQHATPSDVRAHADVSTNAAGASATLSPEDYLLMRSLTEAHGEREGMRLFHELQRRNAASQRSEVTASMVQGSNFVGYGREVAAPAEILHEAKAGLSALAADLPGVTSIVEHGDHYRVQLNDGGHFDIRVTTADLGPSITARSFPNTEQRTHNVQLNERLANANVRRALAHEITELAAYQRQAMSGARPADVDVLVNTQPHGEMTALSNHDLGRVGELNTLATDFDSAQRTGDAADLSRVRGEVTALVERLGLREGAAGAAERRRLLRGQLTERANELLESLARQKSSLSSGDQQAIATFETRSREQQAIVDRDQARLRDTNSRAVPIGDLPDGRVGPDRAAKMNTEAIAAREKKATEVVRELRAMKPNPGEPYPQAPQHVQIGGGAAVAALTPDTLFIDTMGRWHVDTNTEIAQTAGQMGRVPGHGDAHAFAAADERVPLDAIRFMINDAAAHARCVNGRATLKVEDEQTILEITPQTHGTDEEPIKLLMAAGTTPVIATGFPSERAPRPMGTPEPADAVNRVRSRLAAAGISVPDNLKQNAGSTAADAASWSAFLKQSVADPLHEGQQTTNAEIVARDGTQATREALTTLRAVDAWNTEREAHGPGRGRTAPTVLRGDEANEINFKTHPNTEWIIAGVGGTAISAAETILAQTETRSSANNADALGPVHVTMIGNPNSASLKANTQWKSVFAKFGPSAEGRLTIVDGNVGEIEKDGGGYVVKDASGGDVHGGGYIAALGRDAAIPPPIADVVGTAMQRDPSSVRAELMFDPIDHQYLGYSLFVRGTGGEQRYDVTGAASRFLPGPPLFTKDEQAQINQESSDVSQRDAPTGAGGFAGGFASSAGQAAKYARVRREQEEGGAQQ
jgi:hypothetical protein